MSTTIQPFQGSYLTPGFESAVVADVMRAGVMGCPPDAPATTVARIMATHHIHAVLVEGIEPAAGGPAPGWGIVSDLDLVRAARAGLEARTAGELARTDPVVVKPALAVREAARLMDEHETTHLVVSDGVRPIGVLSALDLAGVLAWGRG